MKFKGIQGKDKAAWWSPSAERSAMPSADLAILRWAAETNAWRQLQHAWLGVLARWQHSIVLRRCAPAVGGWFFPLGPVGDSSSVLAWPAREIQAAGVEGGSFFEPDVQIETPLLLPFCELGCWEGCRFVWRSPAWVVSEWPSSAPATRVLPVRSSATIPLKVLAAKCAYWNLSLATLQELIAYLGLESSHGSDLFGAIMTLLEDALPDSTADELVDIACVRMMTMKNMQRSDAADILQIDEAHEALDRKDVADLKRDSERQRSLHTEYREYRKRFAAKRAEVKASTKPAAQRRGKKAGGATNRPLPSDETIPQSVARLLLPPEACIWVARREGQWIARLPGMQSHFRSWANHGERNACLEVLREVWREHADIVGMPLADVPIEGLFGPQDGDGDGDGAGALLAAASSGAGSSRDASHAARSRK